MSKILSIFFDVYLPVILIMLAVAGAIFIFIKVRKRLNDESLQQVIIEEKMTDVVIKPTYCTEDEMRFLEALHKALPRDCIGFPKVGLDNIIDPKGNVNDYNKLLAKYADVCIFLRDGMKPILIIDLYSKGDLAQKISKMDENILKMLKLIKIPVLQLEVQDTYIVEDLKAKLLGAMNSEVVAGMKDKIIKSIHSHDKGSI